MGIHESDHVMYAVVIGCYGLVTHVMWDSHLPYSLNYLIIPCLTVDKASDNMTKDLRSILQLNTMNPRSSLQEPDLDI